MKQHKIQSKMKVLIARKLYSVPKFYQSEIQHELSIYIYMCVCVCVCGDVT